MNKCFILKKRIFPSSLLETKTNIATVNLTVTITVLKHYFSLKVTRLIKRNGWYQVWGRKHPSWAWNSLSYETTRKPVKTARVVSKGLRVNLIRPPMTKDKTIWALIRQYVKWIKAYQICLNPWVHNTLKKWSTEDDRKQVYYLEIW